MKFDDTIKDPKIRSYDFLCNREIMEDIKQEKNNNANVIPGWSFIK
jgi:hypothetical protein